MQRNESEGRRVRKRKAVKVTFKRNKQSKAGRERGKQINSGQTGTGQLKTHEGKVK
jgi:hypothetical protein